ncbi:MAG: hypothetical protein WCT26_04440, partial [Candidatus Buchananbacteria bacterium]
RGGDQQAKNDWGLGGKEFLPVRHGLESRQIQFFPAGADFSCRGSSRDTPDLKINSLRQNYPDQDNN